MRVVKNWRETVKKNYICGGRAALLDLKMCFGLIINRNLPKS